MGTSNRRRHLCDILHPNAELGSLFNDIHPDHGIFSPVLINAQTKEIVPVAKFFDVEQFVRDIVEIADSGRQPAIMKSMVHLSLIRNFDSNRWLLPKAVRAGLTSTTPWAA